MVAILKPLSWDWASSREDAMIDGFFSPLVSFGPTWLGSSKFITEII